jgi:hypothetical protein
MFRNALVGVDGRASGRDAVALASNLTDSDGTVTLAHIYDGLSRVAIVTTRCSLLALTRIFWRASLRPGASSRQVDEHG